MQNLNKPKNDVGGSGREKEVCSASARDGAEKAQVEARARIMTRSNRFSLLESNCEEEAGLSVSGISEVKGRDRSPLSAEVGVAKKGPLRGDMQPRVVIERLSESDTDGSLETVASDAALSRFWKRRKRPGQSGPEDSESESDVTVTGGSPLPKVTKSMTGRGRSRLPTTGPPSWSSKAKDATRREEFLLDAAEEVTEAMEKTRRTRVTRPACMAGLLAGEVDDQLASSLNRQVLDCVNVIKTVSRKSSHLSGPFQKSLNEATQFIVEAVEVLRKRSVTEETAKLQADNTRLQTELAALRKEFADLRVELRQFRVPVAEPQERPQQQLDIEALSRTIMVQVGTMVNARLGAIEERLLPEVRLRPPLAADKNRGAPSAPVPEAPASSEGPAPKPRKGKQGKGSLAAEEAVLAREPHSVPSATPAKAGAWTTVVGKGAKQAAKQAAKPATGAPASGVPAPKKTAPRTVKIRSPRSAAITLTLQAGAAEGGASYASLLKEARTRIDIKSLGIDDLRIRTTATGARLLEVSGETGAEKADSLAAKLKEVLSPDAVRVQRPVKRADIRVTQLDDSVTPQEVTAAMAEQGGCSIEAIKAGGISARGSILLSCPVAAVNTVVKAGRLKVGWISARVSLLETKPLRCFRCLEIGHVGSKCTAEVCHEGLCFRCGKPGHKARECEAEPRCAVCAAAGKPASHQVGGKGCPDAKGSKKSRRGRGKRGMTKEGPKASQPSQCTTGEEDSMDTQI